MSPAAQLSLDPGQVEELLGLEADAARVAWLDQVGHEAAEDRVLALGGAWDALHRCLGDGGLEIVEDGPPAAHAVFGSVALLDEDAPTDVFAALLPAEDVPAAAEELWRLDAAALRERYEALDPGEYGELSSDDFAETLEAFAALRKFLTAAAEAGRAIVFTVDGD